MPVTERLPASLGPYHLEERLGEGGMGVVHLARDPEGRLVALKVLRPWVAQDVNARRRLVREVETMRRVHSPYVAEVLDADVTGEFPYIVTRYVTGPTLDEMVRRQGPLSASGVQRLAIGLADALAAIHAAGVVHRDLKPSNVMLTEDRPVVIDFGIAQAPEATRLTQTGMVMGTPGYLAPEVIEGKPSSPASDIHSWGATVAFAATGRPPYGTGSFETIFYRVVSGRPDLTGVPGSMVPLVSAALARDPGRRPTASWLRTHAADPASAAADLASTSVDPPATLLASAPAPAPAPAPVFRPLPAPKQAARPAPPPGPALPPGPVGRAAIPADPVYPPGADGRADGRAARRDAPASPRWLLGLAFGVAATAITVVLPVAGMLLSVALITLLRAADMAQHRLSVRRETRGPRPSDPLVVTVLAPLSVIRATLTTLLLAPLALGAGTAAWAATIVMTHHATSSRAPAFAAAAVVACYCVGPGSRRPRRQLRRMGGVLARTRVSALAAAVATWALAAAAVTFAMSQPPYFWPAVMPAFPHVAVLPHIPALGLHVGSLNSVVSSTAGWLARHTTTLTRLARR
jgi:predicted Ser/Thr protein kinase